MGPDVHRDPEALRAHARAARQLAEGLEAAVRGRDEQRLPADADVELDRLAAVVRHAVAELGELAAVLSAAATVGSVDADLTATLRQVLSP